MLFKVITTIAVTVPVFVLATQTPDPRGGNDGIAIPLTKRSHTDPREIHTTSRDAKIIPGPSGMDGSETNTGTPHHSAAKRAGSGAGVDLTNYLYDMWYGTISIGTPPQFFTVQLNTASSDLFVPASTGDENCRSHPNLWDPALSQVTNFDLNSDFVQVFTSGRTASGRKYRDNVTIAGFTADIQTIGAATTYSSDLGAAEFAADGLLGLAFPSLSVFYGQSPLLHTLYNEGKLSQPVFSLKLTHSGGELYVGGTNEALYIQNTLVFTPVTNPVYWKLTIDDIKVNGAIILTDVTAVIDTGAHFIIGDPDRLLALHKAAGGGAYRDRGAFPDGRYKGYYTFPCRSFPILTFTFGGTSFSMPVDTFNIGQVVYGGRNCFSGFSVSVVEKDPEFWLIGTILLEQLYTVFDFNSASPRVGFAQLMPI